MKWLGGEPVIISVLLLGDLFFVLWGYINPMHQLAPWRGPIVALPWDVNSPCHHLSHKRIVFLVVTVQ
jgi:hypothetical protein